MHIILTVLLNGKTSPSPFINSCVITLVMKGETRERVDNNKDIHLSECPVKPLFIICESLWKLGEIHTERRMANLAPILKRGQKNYLGSYEVVSHREITPQVFSEHVSRHNKEKLDIWSHQHGLTTCLTSPAVK